jgi:hypothetical protein
MGTLRALSSLLLFTFFARMPSGNRLVALGNEKPGGIGR